MSGSFKKNLIASFTIFLTFSKGNPSPTAILSRQIGGTRGQCVIFNLPGRPKAIRETIDEIWRAVPYCVDLIGGPYIDMNDSVCQAFRPRESRRR